ALVLLAGGTALALTGGEDPDEVVAPSADPNDDPADEGADSEESGAGTGSVVTAVPTTIPTTLALPTTTPPSIAGVSSGAGRFPPASAARGIPSSPSPGAAAPPAPAPTTTTAPDAPLTAGAIVVSTASVGSVVTVSLDWSDPDLPAGTTPAARVVGTGVGALASAPLQGIDGACNGGTGAAGTVTGALRFAQAGPHTVTVELSTCGGSTTSFSAEVSVAAPQGKPIQVRVPEGVNPETGSWGFIPSGGDDAGVPKPLRNDTPGDDVADNNPSVAHYLDGAAATVLVVPDVDGVVTHSVGGCTRSGPSAEVVTLGAECDVA
ncbi:MAG: hypothetical protein ACR2OH_10110, partial [Microthrixaceae bacterium]